ncbi:hypothetical protein CC1G_03391 [Coprinopsis cinerea okayama7|uniref:Uncharacterized protein n=1 Tax=Coprinopsis cinerea (strain Okayama-7 / 130 / ATCC MYA-4618 / FGSC 9003) TaxID=240176 RepID=A8NQJ4_COPC7|nr:hypothetical protein CC1G_03391 [Coprinopsis cinerea okayama7\|eukprot:XP_001835609.2 hypothetical protein CC1G_03391 [Coprinopsis cinerea okayama7\
MNLRVLPLLYNPQPTKPHNDARQLQLLQLLLRLQLWLPVLRLHLLRLQELQLDASQLQLRQRLHRLQR